MRRWMVQVALFLAVSLSASTEKSRNLLVTDGDSEQLCVWSQGELTPLGEVSCG